MKTKTLHGGGSCSALYSNKGEPMPQSIADDKPKRKSFSPFSLSFSDLASPAAKSYKGANL